MQSQDLNNALASATRSTIQSLASFSEFRIQKGAKRLRDLSAASLSFAERRQKFDVAAAKIQAEIGPIKELEAAIAHSVADRSRLRPDVFRLNEAERMEVRSKLGYFEFQLTCMGMTTDPAIILKLNTVQYCVENNLPVERQLLYEICPEMFSYELEDMDEITRRKINEQAVRLEFTAQGELGPAISHTMPLDDHEQLIHDHLLKMHKMMRLLEKRLDERCQAVMPFLKSNFRDERKFSEFLDLLMERTPEQIADANERAIYDVIVSSRALVEDMRLQEEKAVNEMNALNQRIEMPYFVYRNPKLRDFWLQRHKECVVPMDLSDSIIMPRVKPTPDLIDQEMTPAERKALEWSTHIAPGPIAPQLRDHNAFDKNEERVMRAQVLGEVLNRVSDNIKSGRVQFDDEEGEYLLPIGEEAPPPLRFRAGRISFEELERCLALNNSDPWKYNLVFFADYFDLPVDKLRLLFTSLAFPLVVGSRTSKVYRFFEVPN